MLRQVMRCSFCYRNASEVARLVAGPFRIVGGRVYICDQCAAATIRIIEAHAGDDQPSGETQSGRQSFWRRTLTRLRWTLGRDASGRSECHAA